MHAKPGTDCQLQIYECAPESAAHFRDRRVGKLRRRQEIADRLQEGFRRLQLRDVRAACNDLQPRD